MSILTEEKPMDEEERRAREEWMKEMTNG